MGSSGVPPIPPAGVDSSFAPPDAPPFPCAFVLNVTRSSFNNACGFPSVDVIVTTPPDPPAPPESPFVPPLPP